MSPYFSAIYMMFPLTQIWMNKYDGKLKSYLH
jgi:hypothetical protein